jgi:hypothetical protein
MDIYSLNSAIAPDWGDYSEILISGITDSMRRKAGLLELERTGPFVPPISLPDLTCVVVTDALKHRLEASTLTGLSFLPVIKKRIVLLEWEKWDQAADEPQEYPDSGEPEDYILEQPHSEEVAQQIGDLWEVSLDEHAEFVPYQGLANWDGSDWFRAKGSLETFVSEDAKKWLEIEAPQWVTFRSAPTA